MFESIKKKVEGEFLIPLINQKIASLMNLRTLSNERFANLSKPLSVYLSSTDNEKVNKALNEVQESLDIKIKKTIDYCESMIAIIKKEENYELSVEEYHFIKNPDSLL